MKDLTQFEFGKRCHNHMHVVGRDGEFVQLISLAIEEPKGFEDELPYFGDFQDSGTASGIEPGLEAPGELIEILLALRGGVRGWMQAQPLALFASPLGEFFQR